MSTHTVRRYFAWTYATREAWDSPGVEADVIDVLRVKATASAERDGMRVLEGRDLVHTQTQLLPARGEPDPHNASPWVVGDIIPPGMHVLVACQVSVATIDPREPQ